MVVTLDLIPSALFDLPTSRSADSVCVIVVLKVGVAKVALGAIAGGVTIRCRAGIALERWGKRKWIVNVFC